MKQKKVKKRLLLGIFLFGISVFLWNCEKEESLLELQSIENGNPFIKRAKLATLKELTSFVDGLQEDNNPLSKNSLEDANHFTILEDREVFIYTDSMSTTYTLAIRKDNREPFSFSNLIVKFENDAPTKVSILNYVPTEQYLLAYNLDERAPFEGTAAYETIEYDGSLDHLNSKTSGDCITYSVTYCNLGGGTHVADQTCNPDYMWTETYTICEEPTAIVPPPYEWTDTSGDTNSSGGGGENSSDYDGTTAPIVPCEPTGNGLALTGSNGECFDFEEQQNQIRECNLLKDQMQSASFQQKMQELLTATTGNKEIAYLGRRDINGVMQFSDNDKFEGEEGEHEISAEITGSFYEGLIHNHFNDGVSGKALPVFSGGDLFTVYQLYDDGRIPDLSNFVMVVVTPGANINSTDDDTVYAIAFSDVSKFAAFGSVHLNFVDTIDKIFNNKENKISPAISTELNEKRLAKVLKSRNTGMTLYRGDRNNLGDWTRIKSGNNGSIREYKCQ